MLENQIHKNTDLKKLLEEGYSVGVKNDHIYIHNIPVLNSSGLIENGILISSLEFTNGATGNITQHWVYLSIDPHKKNNDGHFIRDIEHHNVSETTIDGLNVFQLSLKPANGYADYYQKIVAYINILLQNAREIDPVVTAMRGIPSPFLSQKKSILNHVDTNASRANTSYLDEVFNEYKVAIIGVGGTGSYILDGISRIPLEGITLFDDDIYSQHNFFRSPGNIPFGGEQTKSKVFAEAYSFRRENIFPVETRIDESNLSLLDEFNFVFLCIDTKYGRKIITDYLNSKGINYIDTGISVLPSRKGLIGQIRISSYVTLPDITELEEENIYQENIQIAEINSITASIAIIEWKNRIGYYGRKDPTNNRKEIKLDIEAIGG